MCCCGKEPGKIIHYLLCCDLYSIYQLEVLNDIRALKESLKNFSGENFLKILLYGAADFTLQMNSETLKCAIKFITKNRSLCWPSISFLVFFFFLSDQVFNICILRFLCSIYVRSYSKWYMSSVSIVSCFVLCYYFYF